MKPGILSLLLLILAAATPLPAQEVVRDAHRRAFLAVPAPDFLPGSPYAVIRVAGIGTLIESTARLFDQGRPSAELLRTLRGVSSPLPGGVTLAGVHLQRPFCAGLCHIRHRPGSFQHSGTFRKTAIAMQDHITARLQRLPCKVRQRPTERFHRNIVGHDQPAKADIVSNQAHHGRRNGHG